MKPLIALSALLVGGFFAAGPETANAAVYCQYVEYPAGCIVRRVAVELPTSDLRKSPPSINAHGSGVILRQDLFDRNSPGNLRSDWPSPPGLPGGH